MNKQNCPTEAIVSVTLNCNARCIMCNIWQNKMVNEVRPEFYHKLPTTLKEINITGGEPFLRKDLPEIVNVMRETCPHARLLINSNGYLISQIKKLMPEILRVDPHIAIRISLDGFGDLHTKIRRLPQFFEKSMESLLFLKNLGIKDLGVSYTLMDQNKKDLLKLFNFCEENSFEFSLTVATDSPIYFGTGKISLRPKVDKTLKSIFQTLTLAQYKSNNPKNWVRAWFNQKLLNFIETNTRYLNCGAADDFFYMDSFGRIYVCHLKPWLLGGLDKNTFDQIYRSPLAHKFRRAAKSCNDCWMVCSARSSIKKKAFHVIKEVILNKFSSLSLI